MYRAAFIRAGVDPRAWEAMSMYELETMFRALSKDNKPEAKEFDAEAAAERWRKLGMADVKV